MINMSNLVKGFENNEDMNNFVVEEVRKASVRHTFNVSADSSDLESYLMIRVWTSVMNNPQYQTERGVRMIIKSRVTNFFNSPSNYNSDIDLFSTLTRSDSEGSETAFEDKFVAQDDSVEDKVINGYSGLAFLASLSDEHKQILELKVDGFNQKDICSIVYPTMAYESSRKKIQRSMKAIMESALDFGLED